ncbi:MAG: FAD-binding protein, partial [Porticoccaceae bacterium]|nr:FAD-binding protein [Porticoccaceae bacterium]
AIVQREGVAVTITAKKGVVLASGGFGANPELRAKYIPLADSHISVQPDENTGDGIRIGQEAGGALGAVNPENGVWAPVSIMVNKDGSLSKYPHFGPDRGKPGSIIVDQSGKRFANEAAPYQTFVNIMQKNNITTAYFIGDHKFLRSYGMGFALAAPYPIGHFIKNGYLIKAPTITALAAKLGINPQTLSETIATFNSHAKDGNDPEFNRGGNAYDNSQGDFNHTPNPNLAPLSEGPFYAVAIHPGDVSTVLGMKTTVDAQVMTEEGAVIDGLYAVGLDQNSVMRGVYPGGGSGIGPGMTFGYRAAKHLAAKT